MKEKKAAAKALKGLHALLAAAGVDADKLAVFTDETIVHEPSFTKSLEAEGILLTLMSDRLPVKAKACKYCGEIFATNYAYVGYCSDTCRAKALAEIGIHWNPHKSAEQHWGSEPLPKQIPSVIGPEALKNLVLLAEHYRELEIERENASLGRHGPPTERQAAMSQALQSAYSEQMQTLIDDRSEWATPKSEFLIVHPLQNGEQQTIEQQKLAENTSPQPSPQQYTESLSQEQSLPSTVFQFQSSRPKPHPHREQ